MSRTMVVRVRYNCWHVSLPYSAKQQREGDIVLSCLKNVNHDI